MSAPTLVYDVVRLLLAARQDTPRGIDRIDLGIAIHLFQSWPGDCLALMPTPWGMRVFERERVLRVESFFEERWPESEAAGPAAPGNAAAARRGRTPARASFATVMAIARILGRTGLSLGRPVRSVPDGAILLNAGHDALGQDWLLSWLDDRPDVHLVAMIHDLVPTLHPALVSRVATLSHARLLDNVARRAGTALVPSAAVGDELRAAMRERGRENLSIRALALPVQDVFRHRDTHAAAPAGRRDRSCFVVCGAIEPRKNHGLLLRVWGEMRRRHGDSTPDLVVAGAAGWQGEQIVRELASGPASASISWRPGLTTFEMRSLMAEAHAVLMPSLAEGFGLPIAEALALGTPVLASDIPAHREAGGEAVRLLSAGDAGAWRGAVEALAFDPAALAAARARAAAFRPVSWEMFNGELRSVLTQISAQAQSP